MPNDYVKRLWETKNGQNNQKKEELNQTVNKVYGKQEFNPFLKKNGHLVNPYINYQKLLDSGNVNNTTKNFIMKATGLTPTVQNTSFQSQQMVTPSTGTIKTKTSVTPTLPQSNNSIVKAAESYIGTPYVWGGESMEEGGMDCSGFVYNTLRDAGYNIGRTTAQGYRNYGTTVSKADMQPGDLVFFGKNGKATHIGVYAGNGKMIHSSGGSKNTASNPGKGVSVTNVDYRSDFLEARRY